MIDWQSILLTAKLAAITAVILLVVGLPLAWWLARSRSSCAALVEAVVALPLVLPPTVLGFYLLLMMGPNGPLGVAYGKLTGALLPFSFQGLVIASVIFSFPFAVQPFVAGFRGIDPRMIEVSDCLGASRVRMFFLVAVPLAWPGLLAGVVLSFAHTLGEFGVALMVGGNLAGVTRTVSISIYDRVQAMDYETAAWTSALMLAFSFAILAVVFLLGRHRMNGVGWN